MIAHHVALDYTLAPGWMEPFVTGLQAGHCMARACATCDTVSFPPTRLCGCGNDEVTWKKIDCAAQILWRTDGADGSFGLVRFKGADTKSVVRLLGIELGVTEGQLAASGAEALPQLVLVPIEQEARE